MWKEKNKYTNSFYKCVISERKEFAPIPSENVSSLKGKNLLLFLLTMCHLWKQSVCSYSLWQRVIFESKEFAPIPSDNVSSLKRKHLLPLGVDPFSHYENRTIQKYWKFYHQTTESFRIKILIFFYFFYISAQNIDCVYLIEPLWNAEIWKYKNVLSENFHFLVVKFSVYLNRHVFVMF